MIIYLSHRNSVGLSELIHAKHSEQCLGHGEQQLVLAILWENIGAVLRN